MTIENNKLKIIQKGFREKLLCQSCETKLSRWENSLKKHLVDLGKLTSDFLEINRMNDNLIRVKNIEYKFFKLAILSILWRMSLSTRKEFSDYQLGPYEEIIRNILLAEANVLEEHFPLFVYRYEMDKVFYPDIMMYFPHRKFDRIYTIYQFIIWGHLFCIIVNNKKVPKDMPKEIILKETGEMFISVKSLIELASPISVLTRIFDDDMKRFYGK
ncbi:hypothetical protein [Candidatus Electronema sp. JC]|uniref:hypothetical protein n=1 Tax=Candidatus Electronema sp. JC TaxID=3401570 RepID=UPI003B435C2B